MPKVLFLGHEALRTGAPLLLLEVIKWLRDNSSLEPSVLLKSGGELVPDYEAMAPTWCYDREFERLNGGIPRRAIRKLGLGEIRKPDLARLYPVEQYPVVYANTIATCDLALELAQGGRRIIHHVHELAYTVDWYGATGLLKKAIPVTEVYIAVSEAVREFLRDGIGVPDSKIRVIHGFPVAVSSASRVVGKTRESIRAELKMEQGAFLIGMCGAPQWRKGTDLFVQLALHVTRLLGRGRCHFVWLGGNAGSFREMNYDVRQAGLEEVCHLVPSVPDPQDYYGAFDLFALTSREDPFSLAMLEAAAAGVPVVCFDRSGGGPELVGNDAGRVVPYLDVPAMAAACVELLLDDERRSKMGASARDKVRTRFTPEVLGPKYLAVLQAAAPVETCVA